MMVGVLAVQGAFIEHIQFLNRLGISCTEIRKPSDLNSPFDGLVLPGGESTVQGKLLHELKLFEPLKQMIENETPVLATCAGMILLASHLSDDPTVHFGTLPVTVKRNAYGRQLGSFHTEAAFADDGIIPMTFIRAPYVEKTSADTRILSVVDSHIVAVQYRNQLAVSFHPELDESDTVHKRFIQMMLQHT